MRYATYSMVREQEQNAEENYHTAKDGASGKTSHRAGQTNNFMNNNQQKPKAQDANRSANVDVDDLGAGDGNTEDINLQDRNVVLNFGGQGETNNEDIDVPAANA